MKRDDIGLTQSPAQAAEGDVRALLKPCPFCGGAGQVRTWPTPYRETVMCTACLAVAPEVAIKGNAVVAWNRRAALSAEAAGTIAAARLAAEEMRERAAKACEAESLKPAYREWEGGYYSGFHDAADIIRHLPLPPSFSPEDQEKAKAAAIPTIADPDGEAR